MPSTVFTRSIQAVRGLTVVAMLAVASVASAQTGGHIGARVFGVVDINQMAASDSFKAVVDTSTLKAYGAGVDVTGLWKNLFARVAFTQAKKDGERAVVSGSTVYPIGVPLSLTMTPIEVGAGWRFVSKSGSGRLTPYVGGGALLMKYKEESPFGASGEDVDISKTGGVVFGGVDYIVVKPLVVGAEVQYRTVPDAIGDGGVSQDFGENDLGGVTFRIVFGVRF